MNKNLRKALAVCGAISLLVFFELSISSCASRSAPSGGPKDTLAPVLDTAFPPNYSTNFSANKIKLVFNEYINLKNGQQQLLISPPLENKPKIVNRGKEVVIEIKDTLRDSTTYIISFGNSITDYTEGNENLDIRYVFSTGSYIDSLELNGNITDAYTGQGAKKLLVGLYDVKNIEKPDSFLYKKLPSYYAISDETGQFILTNLKGGEYRLVAFDDKMDDFLLNSGNENTAFWPRSIRVQPDTVLNYNLRSYLPEEDFRFFRARQIGHGQVQFFFNKKPDSLKIKALNVPEDSSFFRFRGKGDTLEFWFNAPRDSLLFSLDGQGPFKDSLYSVQLREFEVPKLKISTVQSELRTTDTLFVRSNLPISRFNKDSVLYLQKDTTNVDLVRDTGDHLLGFLPPPNRGNFSLKLLPGAVDAWFNAQMDTSTYSVKILRGEDLGTLTLKVKTDTSFQYVLNIFDARQKRIKQVIFQDSTSLTLKNKMPGAYQAYLIQDVNRDGKWTGGNVRENRLPEIRLKFSEPLEIRANWEMDMTWEVKP